MIHLNALGGDISKSLNPRTFLNQSNSCLPPPVPSLVQLLPFLLVQLLPFLAVLKPPSSIRL